MIIANTETLELHTSEEGGLVGLVALLLFLMIVYSDDATASSNVHVPGTWIGDHKVIPVNRS